MKIAMVVMVAMLAMGCSGGGGDNPNGLPTVANQTAHNGGGFHASNLTCQPYCGEGDPMEFRRGISPRDMCDHSICFVDSVCLYGCPDDLTPLCD